MPNLNDPKWTKDEISCRTKIIFSIVFFLLIIFSFIYIYNTRDYGVVIGSKKTIHTVYNYNIEFTRRYPDSISIVQWIIVISLASIVWMWRKKFGITGFIGIQGKIPEEEQYDDDDGVSENFEAEIKKEVEKINSENIVQADKNKQRIETYTKTTFKKETITPKTFASPVSTIDNISRDFLANATKKQQIPQPNLSISTGLKFNKKVSVDKYTEIIINILKKYSVLSLTKIAKMTGLDYRTVEYIVQKKSSLFKKNGSGIRTIVSYVKSEENTAIDDYKKKYIHAPIVSETRHVKIDSYRVNGIIRTNSEIFLFVIINNLDESSISNQVLLLHKLAKKYGRYYEHIVIFVATDSAEPQTVNRIKNNLQQQFEKKETRIEILTLPQTETK